jgi:hypothetical protein
MGTKIAVLMLYMHGFSSEIMAIQGIAPPRNALDKVNTSNGIVRITIPARLKR